MRCSTAVTLAGRLDVFLDFPRDALRDPFSSFFLPSVFFVFLCVLSLFKNLFIYQKRAAGTDVPSPPVSPSVDHPPPAVQQISVKRKETSGAKYTV